MGFLKNIFKKTESASETKPKEANGEYKRCKVVSICGDREQPVYVYYPHSLAKIKDGETFTLTVDTRPTKLKSPLIGGVWDTSKDGYAVRYNNELIGACSFSSSLVKNLVDSGFVVEIKAMRSGWYEPNKIPNIIALTPLFNSLILNEEESKRVKPGYLRQIECKLIPASKNSRAKPHIGFYKKETLLFEFGATLGCYQDYLKYVDRSIDLIVEKVAKKREPGFFYRATPIEYTYETRQICN